MLIYVLFEENNYMLEMQWYLFPLQFIALLMAYLGKQKVGAILMITTIVLTGFCFSTHVTHVLDVVF